jgi:hypothetical protein
MLQRVAVMLCAAVLLSGCTGEFERVREYSDRVSAIKKSMTKDEVRHAAGEPDRAQRDGASACRPNPAAVETFAYTLYVRPLPIMEPRPSSSTVVCFDESGRVVEVRDISY